MLRAPRVVARASDGGAANAAPDARSRVPHAASQFAQDALQLSFRYLTAGMLFTLQTGIARKIFREVFHITKNFVLVCRLVHLLKLLLSRQPLPLRTGGVLHRIEILPTGSF